MRHARRHHGRRQRRGVFSRIAYAFRERQIYLRSEGEVQFITLRPWVQVAAVMAFCAGLYWVAYATVNVAFKDQVLALKERNQYRARLEYEDRIGELRSTIDRLNRRLLLDQRAYLAKVDEVRAEHDKLVERHDRLAEFFQNGWLPAPTATPSGTGTRGDQQRDGSLDVVPRGTITDHGEPARLADAPPLASQAYQAEFTAPEQALEPLDDLHGYMAMMETREASLLDKVIAYMDSRNSEIGGIYRSLGISAGDVARGGRSTCPRAWADPTSQRQASWARPCCPHA